MKTNGRVTKRRVRPAHPLHPASTDDVAEVMARCDRYIAAQRAETDRQVKHLHDRCANAEARLAALESRRPLWQRLLPWRS